MDPAGSSVYYKKYGDGGRSIVALHGGPGMGHEYLEPLGDLADTLGTVVLYDQLGAGRSDAPSDPSAWTVDHFVAELETVRQHLDLGVLDLFGHSWGGWLALSYTLQYPANVRSLVLSNTSASTAEYLMRVQELRVGLGKDLHKTLLRAEAARDFTDPAYQRAILELSARHLRRAWPFELQTSVDEVDELLSSGTLAFGPAYEHMWGPNEFVCTGPLLDWDVTEELHRITVPTLIICGYYDEFTMGSSRTLADGISDSEFVVLGNSSHMNMMEKEAALYMAVIQNFLARNP